MLHTHTHGNQEFWIYHMKTKWFFFHIKVVCSWNHYRSEQQLNDLELDQTWLNSIIIKMNAVLYRFIVNSLYDADGSIWNTNNKAHEHRSYIGQMKNDLIIWWWWCIWLMMIMMIIFGFLLNRNSSRSFILSKIVDLIVNSWI